MTEPEQNAVTERVMAERALESFQDAVAALNELKADELVTAASFVNLYVNRVDWVMDVSRTIRSREGDLTIEEIATIADRNKVTVVDAFLDAYKIYPIDVL